MLLLTHTILSFTLYYVVNLAIALRDDHKNRHCGISSNFQFLIKKIPVFEQKTRSKFNKIR